MLPYALMLPESLPLPLPPHFQILVYCLAAPISIMQSATETPWTLYNPLTSSFKPLHCFSDPLVSLVLGVSRRLSARGPCPKQKLPYRASSASNFQPPLTLKIFLLFYKASKPYSKDLSCLTPGGRGEKDIGSVHPSFWSP